MIDEICFLSFVWWYFIHRLYSRRVCVWWLIKTRRLHYTIIKQTRWQPHSAGGCVGSLSSYSLRKKEKQKKKQKKTKGRTTSKCKWRFERWWVIAVWIDDGLYKLVLRYSSSVPSSVWYSSAGGEIPLRFDDSVGEMNKYDKKMMISTCSSSSMKKKKGREKIEERKKWRNKRGTKPPP